MQKITCIVKKKFTLFYIIIQYRCNEKIVTLKIVKFYTSKKMLIDIVKNCKGIKLLKLVYLPITQLLFLLQHFQV